MPAQQLFVCRHGCEAFAHDVVTARRLFAPQNGVAFAASQPAVGLTIPAMQWTNGKFWDGEPGHRSVVYGGKVRV